MDKVRVDKWLWSVRIYKSRSMATDACKSGHVKLDGEVVKPSTMVQCGQTVQVRKGGFNLVFRISDVIEKRVSAVLAQACYDDLTPEDERNKFKDWFIGKAKAEIRDRGSGRPTKKDRRLIDSHKEKL